MANLNREQLQKISALRRKEGKALLDTGLWAASYYLMGYSIECAIKSSIAKQVRKYDFPDRVLASNVYTHDLEKLMKLAGLWPQFKRDMIDSGALGVNWAVVKDWKETARYDVAVDAAQARDFYKACTSRPNGILTWIRKRW